MKTPEQITAELSQANSARDAAMAKVADAKAALSELQAAAELTESAGTEEEKKDAQAALLEGQAVVQDAERAVGNCDAEIQALNRLHELAVEAERHAAVLAKQAEAAPAAAEAMPKHTEYTPEQLAENWLLQSTSQYRVNHPDGTVFGNAGSEPHVADAWIREQVAAGLLKRTGRVG